jgi:chaperonin GroES
MALKFKPIAGTANRVVVEPAPAEEKTASGLYIPDTAKEKPQKGTVVAVSDIDPEGKKPIVKVGDQVYYGKYSGVEIPIDGVEYLIMKESDIMGTV